MNPFTDSAAGTFRPPPVDVDDPATWPRTEAQWEALGLWLGMRLTRQLQRFTAQEVVPLLPAIEGAGGTQADLINGYAIVLRQCAKSLEDTAGGAAPGTSKRGRNDPCSCGSGRKVKRCCAGVAVPR